MSNVLVINAGSSSLKYQLVDPESGDAAAKGLIERVGTSGGHLKHESGKQVDERDIDVPDHTAAVAAMREAIERGGITLGPALVFGYIAARHLAGKE